MINEVVTRTTLRGIAIVIALVAMIDPVITSRRSTKPDVVVVAADTVRDAALANDIVQQVAKTYTVARGTLSGASATIIAGRSLPTGVTNGTNGVTPIFAVTPGTDRPSLSIESFDAPDKVPALSRVRVDAVVRVTGARGKNVELSLRDDAVSLDHATRQVARDVDTLRVTLSFIPAQAKTTTVRLIAHVEDAVDAVADALIDVREQKWAVLFYDPRPSWMSTFVRRSIERDPRFVATARVVTSRDVNTSTGNPPGRLDDLAALSLFDAVVIGAPQALSTSDVAGLEAFMRRRGGSVVLLFDEPPSGPVGRVIGVGEWVTFAGNQLTSSVMVDNDSLALHTTNRIAPSRLPVGAEPIAGRGEPVVWREPVGAGTVVVSTALDAWRFRDPAMSSFDRFWQTIIGDAASRTPAPLSIQASQTIVAPRERFDVSATLRDEAIDASAHGALQVGATMGSSTDSGSGLHLWPRDVGQLAGRARAPNTPGLYHIALSVGGRKADLPFIVAAAPHRVVRDAEPRLLDWVRATNGAIIPASQIPRLATLLAAAVRVEPRTITWHPMRSSWWVVPFVLALSAEWWLRRRRGLP